MSSEVKSKSNEQLVLDIAVLATNLGELEKEVGRRLGSLNTISFDSDYPRHVPSNFLAWLVEESRERIRDALFVYPEMDTEKNIVEVFRILLARLNEKHPQGNK